MKKLFIQELLHKTNLIKTFKIKKTEMLSVLNSCIKARPSFQYARTFSSLTISTPLQTLRRSQLSNSLESPYQLQQSTLITQQPSIFSNLLGLGGQRRWKSRGNNYQPNTYKRKKTLGFMSRMRSKSGRKIIARRRAKGRWFLAH